MAEYLSSMDKVLIISPTPQIGGGWMERDGQMARWMGGWIGGQTDGRAEGHPTAFMPTDRSCMRLIWSCRGNESTLRSWSLPPTAAVSGAQQPGLEGPWVQHGTWGPLFVLQQLGGSRSCRTVCRGRMQTCGPWKNATAATWTRHARCGC